MGYFTNSVKVIWPAGSDRAMILMEEIMFVDDQGAEWLAPEGSEIDGASIPRFFWRVIGSPFVGRYRRATVIHDVFCKTKSRPHRAVHRMFDQAMRADAVPNPKRFAMARAVRWFGPKW